MRSFLRESSCSSLSRALPGLPVGANTCHGGIAHPGLANKKNTLVQCFHLREAESVGPGIGGGEVGEAGGQEQGWGEEKEEKRNLSRTSWFGNYLNVQGGTESMLKG